MKYIRTKNKICEIEIIKIDKEHNLFKDKNNDISYIDCDVIDMADSIEELCDYFEMTYHTYHSGVWIPEYRTKYYNHKNVKRNGQKRKPLL